MAKKNETSYAMSPSGLKNWKLLTYFLMTKSRYSRVAPLRCIFFLLSPVNGTMVYSIMKVNMISLLNKEKRKSPRGDFSMHTLCGRASGNLSKLVFELVV